MNRKSVRRTPYATIIAIVVVVIYYVINSDPSPTPTAVAPLAETAQFDERSDGDMVESAGTVERVLPDDNDGSRHQRFIVRIDGGQTLLIAHNIDLAPRVEGLARGDTVRFRGRYEVNQRGGVVHWTHHDPRGEQTGGWIEYRGKRYQ